MIDAEARYVAVSTIMLVWLFRAVYAHDDELVDIHSVSHYPVLDLPSIQFSELQQPTPKATRDLVNTAGHIGLVVISEIPNFGKEKHEVLRQLAKCGRAKSTAVGYRSVELADGTTRKTFATRTVGGISEAFSSGEDCALGDVSSHFRSRFTGILERFARLLDSEIAQQDARAPLFPTRNTTTSAANYSEFSQVMGGGEQLEHFHLYVPSNESSHQESERAKQPSPRPTLSMHTDAGVLLAMTSAEYFDPETLDLVDLGLGGNGFILSLPNGSIVQPRFAPNSLLVMFGEAARHWINPPIDLHVPTHAMVMPPKALLRAWYGRMVFPLAGARFARGEGTGPRPTWGEYSEGVHKSFQAGQAPSGPALGCAPRRKLEDSGSCSGDSIYCWHSCVPVDYLPCGKEAVCLNSDGSEWDGNSQQHDASAQCLLSPPPPLTTGNSTNETQSSYQSSEGSTSTNSFCNDRLRGISMFMSGFQTIETTTSNDPCVVVLFEEWKLDSNAKFIGACFGTIVLGIVVEFIMYIRRRLASHRDTGKSWRMQLLITAGIVTLYGVQLTLGYFMMLITMTYQVELFCMVIVGLMLGHMAFNTKGPISEKAEPCCVGLEKDEKEAA
ncbi:hypothetical protein CYMTET_31022 [Cymbomonas tetramitiformis]|uniref:Fe2OG dioxygenase domain-containing protein n=1 Tax=Cymbomonas tetramitiformis TaxID=36881 RepID=A0AAE0FHZ8_9CHLO|nr:hypothetical protein CYMTET_31022 [Cymbomonas tetramitiformis]|eukprot:gene5236-6367_t